MVSTRRSTLVAVGGLIASVVAYPQTENVVTYEANSTTADTCTSFKASFPGMTILPSENDYRDLNEFSWSREGWLGPACILTPSCAEELSSAVKTLVERKTPFAIRGGGHMPIGDAANINSTGVLIASSKMRLKELSEDLQTLTVGVGSPWGEVYEYLDTTKTGKMVVGGRYAPVGIPGYMLGGGISFYSYEYGMSAANGNVRSYECVLADGSIAKATADNEFSDLFWALQGGGNSFCLLTKIELRTIDSPVISMAGPKWGGYAFKEQFLQSTINYVTTGDRDLKSAFVPLVRWGQNFTEPSYEGNMWYNGNVTKPEVFTDYQGGILPENNSTVLRQSTMGQFAASLKPFYVRGGESAGKMQLFHVVSHAATITAMRVVHDTFLDGIQKHNLKEVDRFFSSIAYNTVTPTFAKLSQGMPQGIPQEAAFWSEQAVSWVKPEDGPRIRAFIDDVNANITAQLEASGELRTYLYLNDAELSQPVFQGYPPENLARLKEIRAKYDPNRVYTDQMPGGFKVEHA